LETDELNLGKRASRSLKVVRPLSLSPSLITIFSSLISLSALDDECIEGGKTIAQWLFDTDIYNNMSLLQPPTPRVEKFVASSLHFSSSRADLPSGSLISQGDGSSQAHPSHDVCLRWRGLHE